MHDYFLLSSQGLSNKIAYLSQNRALSQIILQFDLGSFIGMENVSVIVILEYSHTFEIHAFNFSLITLFTSKMSFALAFLFQIIKDVVTEFHFAFLKKKQMVDYYDAFNV